MSANGAEKFWRRKIRLLFLNLGKLILDAVKLSFGGLVLGTIIKGDFSSAALLKAGIIVSVSGAVTGILMVTFLKEE